MPRLPLLAALSLALLTPPCFAERNLAAGLPATFDPAPSYKPCTDPEDALQLTDGAHAPAGGLLWVQKEAVGWVHPRKPVLISFDLGEPKRISAVSVRSAAGHAGVYWPAAIGVYLSEDGKTWAFAGEVISQSIEDGLPEPMAYSEHRFTLGQLAAKARYVTLCIARGGSGFFITDEVEITEDPAPGEPRALPPVGDLAAVREHVAQDQSANLILRRIGLDATRLRTALERAALSAADKAGLLGELHDIVAKSRLQPPEVAEDFRTVVPIVPAQEQLLSLHGRMLQKLGYPNVLLAKTHRNAYLGWLETPRLAPQQPIELASTQMSGEARADLFVATNATGAAMRGTLKLNAPADAVQLFYCPWTDTPQLEPVATALLPAEKVEGGWSIPLPAGVTTKIWVRVDGGKLPPGTHLYEGTFSQDGGEPVPVRLTARVSPVKMGVPGLHLGMWDELNGKGSYAINPKNAEAAIRLMRSHGVDSPWATPRALALPEKDDFDAQDRLLPGKPDFAAFDAWLEQWPNARRYMVFLNVPSSIGGVRHDSPRFAGRVEQWAHAAWQHLASRGLKPGQVFLLLVDEPKSEEQDRRLLAWAEPIKKAAPELMVWSDPVWQDPANAPLPAAFEVPDVLCPNAGALAKGGPKAVEFYRRKKAEGKPLETYACSALAPHTDPNRYFRMLPWLGWPLRVQGVGYWAFGDTGGLADCWNAYGKANGIWYTPAFIGKTDATDTLHWQAVREGVLDHEYLRMLEEALPRITDPVQRKQAEQLLSDEAVTALFDGWNHTESASWKGSTGQEAPDRHRLKILALLEQLPPEA